jgi:hypothetical protein
VFFRRKLKHEIAWKSADIPLHLLVEAAGRDPVQVRQVSVEEHLLAPQDVNGVLDAVNHHELRLGHS